MLEKLTNMVPKWSQNLSKIDPGGGLEATWEPSLKQKCFQDMIFEDLGSILGLPLGLVLVHFEYSFCGVFWM